MSRDSEAVASLLLRVLRVGRGRAPAPLLLIGCVLLVGYFLVEPSLQRTVGHDLPGVHEYEGPGDSAPSSRRQPPRPGGRDDQTPPTGGAGSARTGTTIESLIRSDRDTYTSPAGLRYARGTVHGHHLRHLMAHSRDEPDRPGQHGVFDSAEVMEIVLLVDEAYRFAESGRATVTRAEGDRTVHVVDMGRRIGYVGGQSGARRGKPPARHVQLVLVGDKLITAYPLIP